MAVDTAEKRFSMLNFGDGTTIHLLFETDGAVDGDDRQHLLDCYSGIAFGAPAGGVDELGSFNLQIGMSGIQIMSAGNTRSI